MKSNPKISEEVKFGSHDNSASELTDVEFVGAIPNLQNVNSYINDYRQVGRKYRGMNQRKKASDSDIDDFISATKVAMDHEMAPLEYIDANARWHDQITPGKFVPPHQLHSEHSIQVAVNTGRRPVPPRLTAERQLRVSRTISPMNDETYRKSLHQLKAGDSPDTFEFDIEYVFQKQLAFAGKADHWVQKLYEDFENREAMNGEI